MKLAVLLLNCILLPNVSCQNVAVISTGYELHAALSHPQITSIVVVSNVSKKSC